jgi:multiple sugar transport system substrate-binding protein
MVAMAGAMAAVLVTACSGTGAKTSATADVQFLDIPYSTHTVPMFQQAADDFAAQSHVKINISQVDFESAHAKFLSLLQAHKQPDFAVFAPKWLPEFIRLGVLEPLDTHLPKSFFDQFPKTLIDQVTFDGHIYALPEALSTRLMFYRKDLFNQAGIAPPTTLAQFLPAAQKLNQPPNQYGFLVQGTADEMVWNYTYFLYGFGGSYTDASGNWAVNQPTNVQALQYEADLANKYHVTQPNPVGSGLDTVQQLFVKGKAAMIWGPPWILSIIQEQNPGLLKNIGVTDYPTLSGNPAPMFMQDAFVMFKGAKNPTAAADFLKFWNQDKYQVKFNTTESLIPVTTSSAKAPEFTGNPNLQRFISSIPYSRGYPVKDGWIVVNTEVNKAIQSALLGTTTAQQALDTAQQAILRQTKK